MLSKHFSEAEFTCNCGRVHKVTFVEPRLVNALELLRTKTQEKYPESKVSIKILPGGGVRCAVHNSEVSGATSSQHLYAKAGDIVIIVDGKALPVKEMYELALLVPDFEHGGIGVYPDQNTPFIHVDVRLGKARWGRIKKKKKDVYVSIEEGLKV